MSAAQLSITFFLQLFVILAACRTVGWVVRRWLGQPQVVGEIIAGILLGPSLFGLLAPDIQQMLFPPESRGVLYVGAQLGIGLCMFMVGLNFRIDHLGAQARSAVAVSLSGVLVPFIAAVLITPWLLHVPGLFGEGTFTVQAMLFMGAALSITAFPVLARILQERGLADTRLGALALSAGAVGDVVAWVVLAVVLASIGAAGVSPALAVLGVVMFILFMLTLGRRLLAPLGRIAERHGRVGPELLAGVLMLFLLAAFVSEMIGVHAVFGGFILGVAMPRGLLNREIRRQIEPFALVLLAPLFFAYSGLHTELSVMSDPALLPIALVVLIGAVVTKFGACWAAARMTGLDNPTALGIGALMNARGMMELILINIALQAGLIGPALFSILVLVTVATTLMATPLFEHVYGRRARARGELGDLTEEPPEAPAIPAAIRD